MSDARKRTLDFHVVHDDGLHLVGVFHTHSPLFVYECVQTDLGCLRTRA